MALLIIIVRCFLRVVEGRLEEKCTTVTNTLAYYNMTLIMAEKSFCYINVDSPFYHSKVSEWLREGYYPCLQILDKAG